MKWREQQLGDLDMKLSILASLIVFAIGCGQPKANNSLVKDDQPATPGAETIKIPEMLSLTLLSDKYQGAIATAKGALPSGFSLSFFVIDKIKASCLTNSL